MDSGKTRLSSSLQFRLGVALTVLMILAALLIGAIAYFSTRHDAHELQDDYLVDIAAMVDIDSLGVDHIDARNLQDLDDPASHVVIQIIDPMISSAAKGESVQFPDGLSRGVQSVTVADGRWRVYVREAGAKKIVVGQRIEVRDQLARRAGVRTLLRVLEVIPFLLLFQALMVRWMLKPLNTLAQELNQRPAEDLRELDQQALPAELQPLLASMNAMLQRIAEVFAQQRRFVADAAHELRSPLTALTLQSKNLALQDMSELAREQLALFERGLHRANTLVDQLLSMARAQLHVTEISETTEPVSLQQTLRTVFEELMPLADANRCEIGLEPGADVTVRASRADMMTLLRNLVDNAIRYGGQDGRVSVAFLCVDDMVKIQVQDDGPGIPADQIERVFDPFYRVLGSGQSGSGLGLSIVKNIVLNLRGEVTIGSKEDGHGTVVTVRFAA